MWFLNLKFDSVSIDDFFVEKFIKIMKISIVLYKINLPALLFRMAEHHTATVVVVDGLRPDGQTRPNW